MEEAEDEPDRRPTVALPGGSVADDSAGPLPQISGSADPVEVSPPTDDRVTPETAAPDPESSPGETSDRSDGVDDREREESAPEVLPFDDTPIPQAPIPIELPLSAAVGCGLAVSYYRPRLKTLLKG